MAEETVETRSVRRSICPCGHAALDDHVPLGRAYRVRLETARAMIWICGGCGRRRSIRAVWVEPGGYMPLEVFAVGDEEGG